ncbi:class I adenylate-forming enzyme family protein [Natronorubrum texcoconense]|uniref:AMP-binding enzyme C-terminal domain-containing protein n=1 Tax=Natronorubrum texcoconense TaxID=1095776 RepID=A0A1G9CNG4_9EURY|nr:AMP-binding protein [Natronorubrum texcoconense]SDK53119.1 AMP-binding enzyme C-terminal domain-containing protein [Natronorubrum texcoconense]
MTQPTTADLLGQAAARFPDRAALREPARDETVSFAELDERAQDIAAGLLEAGFEPGDHLSVLLTDSIEFVELLFASAYAGLVFNPISYRVPPKRLAYVLEHAESAGLVFDEECLETVDALEAEALPNLLVGVGVDAEPAGVSYEQLEGGDGAGTKQMPAEADVDESDPALLLYTSGTTGRPKGVLHSHRTVVNAALVSLPYNRLRPTDVNVALGPLYHVGPLLCNVLPALNVGACNVVQHEFDPATTLERIESEGITTMWGVPTHVRALVDEESIGDCDIEHVRMIQYSGAAMPAAVAKRARDHVSDCEFVNAYGTTEIVFGTLIYPEFHDEKLGSIGQAAPNAAVRVVDSENPVPDAVVDTDEVGELLVNASTCLLEYWRDPAATDEAIVDGWYRTGDLGRRDEDGFLYFVDRKDDMIVSGGENIYPAEVENLLHSHPDVVSGAVVGVPDDEWGEVVTAFVVPASEDLSSDDLEGFFVESDELESFKRPRQYVFERELPKTSSDKIDRRALLDSISTD